MENDRVVRKQLRTGRQLETRDRTFMSLIEFCERLGMSEEWGRKKIAARQIEFIKVGRAVRIPESEFNRLVRESTIPVKVAH